MAPSALSPQYTRWIEDATGARFASEPGATCADCAMCRPTPGELVPVFDGSVKCCTYWPALPNFLVGRGLREPGVGADRLRDAIARRIGATPLGLDAGPTHTRRYVEQGSHGFGRDATLTCPYLYPGGCSLWANRNAVCQSWFCKIEDGLPGATRWNRLTSLLMMIEDRLATSLATSRMRHPDFFEASFLADGRQARPSKRELPGWVDDDGALSEALHARLWGPWIGREEAFYLECADEADGLDWAELRRRLGPEAEVMAARLRAAIDASSAPPARLRPAVPGVELSFQPIEDGVAFSHGRSGMHVGVVSEAVWGALFGDSTLPAEPLDDGTRRALWRDGLLVEGDSPEAAPLSPTDRLRVRPGLKLVERIVFSPEGVAAVTVTAGAAELTFDEAPLLGFGRQLVSRQDGFVASEAVQWAPDKTWEEVTELLTTLLGMGVLDQVLQVPATAAT